MRLIGASLFVLGLSACVTAQEAPVIEPVDVVETETVEAPAPQFCASEAYHAFDFWLGKWEVFDTDGTKAGDNHISRQESGCLLLEEWLSVGGNSGQSYNFYDPAADEWRQVWVSKGAVIDYAGNLTETGSMKLRGTISYRSGASFPFTGEWTLQEDGSVRQYFEQYSPESDTWDEWFTGIYRRAPTDKAE